MTATCDFVAGCDGFHGVSRASIPADVLTLHSHECKYSWLSVMAEAPMDFFGMAINDHGLAARFPRGADASRLYLQCPAGDTPEQCPDECIWSELQTRSASARRPAPSSTNGSCLYSQWYSAR